MRYGFTTGSCAAAAAKAATYMLLTGMRKETISIETPKGITYSPQLKDVWISETAAGCAVEKDGGDDPDITTGAMICAEVRYAAESVDGAREKDRVEALMGDGQSRGMCGIFIEGGEGVGRVTRPGLDQPVGNAAINHVPRMMIEREVREVCELCDYRGSLRVTISVPQGEELAEKTFNPRLGIEGGISILGTSGIVEPMSSRAILDTIAVELNVRRAEGAELVAVSPGNYGLAFMKWTYGYDLDRSVKCSNFIGETIDMAREKGFSGMLLTGHIGKLIKVSGGIMNTHSREGDCRMELLAAAAVRAMTERKARESAKKQQPEMTGETRILNRILDCSVTEEALDVLRQCGILEQTMRVVVRKIGYYLRKRGGGMQTECIVYSNDYGELGCTDGAEDMLRVLCADGGELGKR